MKRLLMFAVFAGIVWYGWHHLADLKRGAPNDAILVNHSGHPIERIRLKVGSETLVRETLADGESATMTFRGDQDAEFEIVFQPKTANSGERHWSGGTFTHGPVRSRHTFEFVSEDGVIWTSALKEK